MRLKTAYEIGEIPHSEHPLPQAMRESWLCLNGVWSLQKFDETGKQNFAGQVLVPFSPESLNSGVEEGFLLKEKEFLLYERTFSLTDEQLQGKCFLHFGAVDSECEVFVNGKRAGGHKCGFTPFRLDITWAVQAGENRLTVRVLDEATRNSSAFGKQKDDHSTIWYTPQSGIWQTVWLEFTPHIHIENLRITPNLAESEVKVEYDCEEEVTVRVLDGETELLSLNGKDGVVFRHSFALWSPENPKLYDLILTTPSGDCVHSYFGMRAFSIVTDQRGKKRLGLNGKPYFYNGVLDQGYWSDGMLTYPCDQAAIDELTMLKEMGFNTVRKHIKVEPMRWYHHCDRLGLVVWQDFVNGGNAYNYLHIALLPFLGFKHKDGDYKYFAREDEEGRAEYRQMMQEIVNAVYNCVSVGVYVPFNEGWGQFDSARITKELRGLDDTRIVDSVSGWHDQGVDETPILSLHTYFTPLKVPRDKRAVVLSEFGGYSWKIGGHVYDENKEYGYKKFRDKQSFLTALEKLFIKKLLPLIDKGLSASIYTQVSDVEEEINGLVTYDRKVQKVPTEFMRNINDRLKEVWEKIE